MERLTFDGLFCDIAQCKETPGGTLCENGSCSQRKVWERLKAYEDTGLEPEKVERCKLTLMGKSLAEITEFDGVSIERLKELAKADKEGRLVVLPCKVGDVVYKPVHGVDGDGVWEIKVEIIDYNWYSDGSMTAHAFGTVLPDHGGASLNMDDLGKNLFLTREEAERALEGQK